MGAMERWFLRACKAPAVGLSIARCKAAARDRELDRRTGRDGRRSADGQKHTRTRGFGHCLSIRVP